MLALDDDLWRTLPHAYGTAGDIPGQLRALAGPAAHPATEERIWEHLWSALCHQGSVAIAAYAAVPHLVALAAQRGPADRSDYLVFVATVVATRDRPAVPAALAPAFADAVTTARDLAATTFTRPDEERDALIGLVVLAGLHEHAPLAEALEALLGGEHNFECPECELELFVTLEELPFVVTVGPPEDTDEAPTELAPRAARAEVAWAADLARAMGQPALAGRVEALDGTVTCPHCDHRCALLDHLGG